MHRPFSLHWPAACLAGMAWFAPMSGMAQSAPAGPAPATSAAAPCEAAAGAAAWVPCGPDRKLSEAEAKSHFFKDGQVTKILMTGGKSGKKFFANFKPGGKLDSGFEGGTNIGKSWRFQDGRLCRDYYRISDVHCGVFEVSGAALYLVDDDGSRSPVTSVQFAQP